MRRVLALAAVFSMVVLAGCMGGVISEENLAEEATYDWETTETVTVNVTGDSYKAVYVLENHSSVELYHRGSFGGEEPLPIRAIQFRYPNGTVVNASAMTVEEGNDRTIVEFPEREGKFAYSAQSSSGDLFFPVVLDGSYEVVLPPGSRIEVPIIGGAEPPGYERTVEGDRVHIVWEEPDRDVITVTYYLQRDLYLFSGLIGILVAVAGGGLLYFRFQLRGLADRRSDVDLVDEDDR